MLRVNKLGELAPEQALQAIAQAVDDAADLADTELTSQALDWCAQVEPRLGSEAQRVLLDYFRANARANRMVTKRNDASAVLAWDQP